MMKGKYLKLVSLVTLGLFSINANAQYDCNSGKYCKEMASCDEAYYKLKVCGIDRLDRDGDGVPCENVCGKGGKKQSKQSKKAIDEQLKKQQQEEEQAEKQSNSQE